MKKLLLILTLLIGFFAGFSQAPIGCPTCTTEIKGILKVDSLFLLPYRNDTLVTPGRPGAMVEAYGKTWLYTGTQWSVLVGAAWGNIPGNITSQTDLMTLLNGKQDSIGNGYGWKKVAGKGVFDSAVVRKVDTIGRINDSTIFFAVNGRTFTFTIRGSASGSIVSSISLVLPTSIYLSPVNYTNAGGAWTGTVQLQTQNPNTVWAGPQVGSPGQPGFRSLAIPDLPTGIPPSYLQTSAVTFWNFKVDSTVMSNDSVYEWRNGLKFFRYFIVGGGGGTASFDTLKGRPVDTGAAARSGYYLGYDSLLKKWKLYAPAIGYDSVIMQTVYRTDTAKANIRAQIAAAATPQTVAIVQGQTYNTVALSGSNTDTLRTATTNLAGLLDTTRTRWIDSARAGQLTDTTVYREAGVGQHPFYLLQTTKKNTLVFPKHKDSIDLHYIVYGDSTLAAYVQAHDTSSSNALQTKYRSDTSRANIYSNIAGKVANLAASTGIRAGAYLSRPSASNCQCYYWSTDSAFWSYDNGSWKDLKPGSGGGGGSQTLPQVLSTGRYTAGDDSLGVNGYNFRLKGWGDYWFGDTVRSTIDTVIFLGDSWTVGQMASPLTDGYAFLTAAHAGANIFNLAINGSQITTILSSQLPSVPNYNASTHRFIFICDGINDAIGSTWSNNYRALVDSLIINRGYPASRIVLLSSGFTSYTNLATNYQKRDTVQLIASQKGTLFIDQLTAMVNNGGGALMFSDSTHPNTFGHYILSRNIIRNLNMGSVVVSIGGRLGVGTTRPQHSLDVMGGASFLRRAIIDTLYVGRGGGSDYTDAAIGFQSMTNHTKKSNSNNTAVGYQSLFHDTSGTNNTAIGSGAMSNNYSGLNNTAMGSSALATNSTGTQNVAVGASALYTVNASNNTAVGHRAGFNMTSGFENTLIGGGVGLGITSGFRNTVLGFGSLTNLTTNTDNVALGYSSSVLVTGTQNTAGGNYSLLNASSGNRNVAFGYQALFGNAANQVFSATIAIGANAGFKVATGADSNIFIGAGAGNLAGAMSGKNNIIIGSGDSLLSNTTANYINIGHVFFGDRSTGRVSIKTSALSNSFMSLPASTTSYSSLNIPSGTAPSSPNHGDVWTDANHIYGRLNGVTYQLDQQSGGATNVGSTQNATNYSVTSSTGTGTTLNTATTNLAGLLDTARARYIDSARNRLISFSVTAKNGLRYRSSDSAIIEGGAYDEDTYKGGAGKSLYLGTPGSLLDSAYINAATIAFNRAPNIGGFDMPTVVDGQFFTGQTTNLSTVYSAPADGDYEVGFWLKATITGQMKMQVSFTDHNNTVQTIDLVPNGGTAAMLTTSGYYLYNNVTIRAKSGTDINVKSTSVSSATYDFSYKIKRL